MKRLFTNKTFVALTILVVLIAAYLFFTRPVTLNQLYPELTYDKCTGVNGFYETGHANLTEFSFEKESQEFQELYALFYDQSYRRSLRDILPGGTRTHSVKPEDFSWRVRFQFEETEDGKGNSSSGDLLWFEYWFNHELDIYFTVKPHAYNVSEQEVWSKKVLDIISQEADYVR